MDLLLAGEADLLLPLCFVTAGVLTLSVPLATGASAEADGDEATLATSGEPVARGAGSTSGSSSAGSVSTVGEAGDVAWRRDTAKKAAAATTAIRLPTKRSNGVASDRLRLPGKFSDSVEGVSSSGELGCARRGTAIRRDSDVSSNSEVPGHDNSVVRWFGRAMSKAAYSASTSSSV